MSARTGDTPSVREGNGSETLAALLIGWGVNVVALLVVALLLPAGKALLEVAVAILALTTVAVVTLTLTLLVAHAVALDDIACHGSLDGHDV